MFLKHTWFYVGQHLLQSVCACVRLSLARVANINCGPELNVFTILLQRFPSGDEYLFLIPFWTVWKWGLAGKNGYHRMKRGQFTDSWQGHFYEMPDELLPQGVAWTLVSGSSITCVQGFLCPQFFPASIETVPLIWCWDLQHKQDWGRRSTQNTDLRRDYLKSQD